MKIDSGSKSSVSKAKSSKGTQKASGAKGAKGAKGAQGGAQGGRTKSVEGVSVEVSDHSETLGMIREIVAETPDVRVGEVERIVDEIKNGKYKLNFEKIAEGFIREAIENEMARRMRKN